MDSVDSKISRARQILGGHTDMLLVAEALQMKEPLSRISINNRLEYVKHNAEMMAYGGTILDFTLSNMWWDTRRVRNELLEKYDWDSIRQKIAGKANLARLGSEIGIGECIIVHDGQKLEKPGVNMVAQTMKALIAAVFLDSVNNGGSGLDAVELLIERIGLNDHPVLRPTSEQP